VQKQNGLAMGSDLRFAVTQNPRAFRHQPVTGRHNVRHFIANMMHAAGWILFKEALDWRVFT
jgi:hypothetical protein